MEFAVQRRRRPAENIVPLINVVFLLLVFFMLTGSLRPPAPLEIELPRDVESSRPVPRANEIPVLMLSATGELALDGRAVSLEGALGALAEASPSLALHADARVPARVLLPLLLRLEDAGVEQVDLVTRHAP